MVLITRKNGGWGWGGTRWSITGTLSDQTDLQTALDSKANTSDLWDLAYLDEVDTNEIVNHAVTNTKLAQMNSNTVKGRLSGNGTPQDIAMEDLPISTATQTALNTKQDTLVSGTNIKTINGTSLLGSGNIVLTSTAFTQDEIDKMMFFPASGKSFLGDTNISTRGLTKSNYQQVGNFTVVRKLFSGTSGYNAKYVTLKNSANDEIFIGAIGYTFTITLKKAGVTIFNYTVSSSTVFPTAQKISSFLEVDYILNRVRLTYSGFELIVPIPELVQLKDTVFNNITLYPNTFFGSSKNLGAILLSGLYDFTTLGYVFSDTTDTGLVEKRMIQDGVGVELFNSATRVNYEGVGFRNFDVNGEATYEVGSVDNKSNYFRFDWNISNTNVHYNAGAIFQIKFSIEVLTETLKITGSGGTPYNFLTRAVNKNTGDVLESRMKVGSPDLVTLPVGEWEIYMIFSQGYSYTSLLYYLYLKTVTGTSFKVKNDVSLRSAGITLSILPESTNYSESFCQFSNQKLTGTWTLSSSY